MELTDEDLAEMEACANGATPGPWDYVPGICYKHYVCGGAFVAEDGREYDELRISLQEMHPIDGHDTRAEADCRFIANAREYVPALLAEVRRLRVKAMGGAESATHG